MTDDKLHNSLVRADQAKALLEHELLAEAFKTLEDRYVAEWRITSIDNVAGREKLFIAINIVGKVKEHLTRVVSNGTLAQRELKDLTDRKKRFGVI